MNTRKAATKPASVKRPINEASSLLSKATRIAAAEFDRVTADMRLSDDNLARTRQVLVEGMGVHEVARDHGVSAQLVSSAVRRVRRKLNDVMSPWTFVSVSLSLPLTLAEELRGLSDALAKMQDTEHAEALLRNVLKATAVAKAEALS